MRRFLASAPALEGISKKQRMEPDSAALGTAAAPLQCSRLTPTLLTTEDVLHARDCKMNTWVNHNGMMYKLGSGVNRSSNDMVAFDMDSTLITTKSGKTYAVDEHDWKLWDPSVRTLLQKLYSEGKYIAIISNQNGIKVKAVSKEAVQRKVDKIIESIGVPMDFICAIDDNHFRKPRTGMWEFLCYARRRETATTSTDGAVPMFATSLYVGDAAGRPQEGIRGKDHSDSDYKLALNMNIEFATPEKYFLRSTARLHSHLPDPRAATGAPFRLVDVAAASVYCSDDHYVPPERRSGSSSGPTCTTVIRPAPAPRPPLDPSDSPERDDSGYEEALWAAKKAGSAADTVASTPTGSDVDNVTAASSTAGAVTTSSTPAAPTAGPEILLLAAPPACGKSTLARRYEAGGYVRVNQDTIGSVDKCIAAARQALAVQGSSVCVDNTNMDPSTRQKWVQLAKQCGVQIRTIALKTPREVSSLLSAYRLLDPTTLPGDRRKIERIVVNTYFKNPIYPALREGFSSVESLDLHLVPPADPQALRLFHMYLK